jgi:dual oxidase
MCLVVLAAVIYIFAIPLSRRHLHRWFWMTHSLYPLFYALIILHGAARLVQVKIILFDQVALEILFGLLQEPFFHYFFLGPCVLFVLDMVVSLSRKTVEIPVVKAELLPSGLNFC